MGCQGGFAARIGGDGAPPSMGFSRGRCRALGLGGLCVPNEFAGESTDKQFNYRIQLLAAARGVLGSTQR